MDLSFTQSQEMLKAAARAMVDREFPTETLLRIDAGEAEPRRRLWERTVGAGWPGILIPTEYGGAGGSLTDAAALLEELGRGPVAGPHLSAAVIAPLVALEAGSVAQKRELLPRMASGEMRAALAVTEESYGWSEEFVRATATVPVRGGGYALNGTKLYVQDAGDASHLLCAARLDNGAVGLFVVDAGAPGVSVRPLPGFISESYEVVLDGVEVDAGSLLGDDDSGGGWAALERALQKAAPVLGAYQVGACESVFAMTLDYSNTRVQFGMPIGRFQRVQDHVIDIVNRLDAARWTTYEALWKLDEGKPGAAEAVHVSKIVASEAYYQVCNSAHEVHAGLGIMREYGLTLHTKMSRTLYHYLGDPAHHKRRLAAVLDL